MAVGPALTLEADARSEAVPATTGGRLGRTWPIANDNRFFTNGSGMSPWPLGMVRPCGYTGVGARTCFDKVRNASSALFRMRKLTPSYWGIGGRHRGPGRHHHKVGVVMAVETTPWSVMCGLISVSR